MSTWIEGRNAVIEALRSGMPLRRVLIAQGVTGEAIAEIERLATRAQVRVERTARARLDSVSDHGSHQGVAAEAASFAYAPLEAVLERVADSPRSLLVALDQVTDPGNLGAVARCAEVAGADAVIVPARRSASVGSAAFKSSAGALAHLPLVQETNLVRALKRLKEAGYWIAGADGSARTLAWDAELDGRLVLVMGAEGSGLSRLVRETCDFLVALPVAGRVDSLNVAQATAVLAFEWVRRGRSE